MQRAGTAPDCPPHNALRRTARPTMQRAGTAPDCLPHSAPRRACAGLPAPQCLAPEPAPDCPPHNTARRDCAGLPAPQCLAPEPAPDCPPHNAARQSGRPTVQDCPPHNAARRDRAGLPAPQCSAPGPRRTARPTVHCEGSGRDCPIHNAPGPHRPETPCPTVHCGHPVSRPLSMPDTRASPRTRSSTGVSQDSRAASPSMTLRHKMKERVRQSVGRKHLSDPRRQSISDKTSLPKKTPTILPDLDNDTPRVVLRRIIQTQPQVSPLVPKMSETKEPEEPGSQPPSERISSGLEMHLPDFVPEGTVITALHMSRKKKKFSISDFERGADERLPRNLAQPALDNSSLTRSLQISLATPVPPESVEKRGLIRRPKNRKTVNVEAFEGGVEQNLLQIKGTQNYLAESQATSMIGMTMGTSDTEIILSNTELFAQPQLGEQSQAGFSAPEQKLLKGKIPVQGRKASNAATEEGMLSDVDAEEGMTQRLQKKDLARDPEHTDQMTTESRGRAVSLSSEQRERTRGSSYAEQLPGAEERVAGVEHRRSQRELSWDLLSSDRPSSSPPAASRSLSRRLDTLPALQPVNSSRPSVRETVANIIEKLDDAEESEEVADVEQEMEDDSAEQEGAAGEVVESPRSARTRSSSRHSSAMAAQYPAQSGRKLMKEAVEREAELGGGAVIGDVGDSEEEEMTEEEAETEEPESEELSMKTPAFVRAKAYRPSPLLSTPRTLKTAASKFPPKPPRAQQAAKRTAMAPRRKREPALPSSLVKKIFSHYVKVPVARDAFKVVEKCVEVYFRQLSNDLEAYTMHARRKTVEEADLELLMRRQGLVTDKMPLHVLIERHLPLEHRKLLIPVATSGNKVIPHK
ncbi:centromere protein T isoform X2 [Chrysemys picta bellii]|uniref:centromere protein T isoform X2 n=2 Tax=Chrysemys picta bellii TaxID=8478 RepID=UPI0032B1355E